MAQSNTARAANDESAGNRPVAKFKHGAIELSVWANHTDTGTMYNTTISNSYKDEQSGEWKTATSYSPTDLLVIAGLSREAFAEIGKLKQPGQRGNDGRRYPRARGGSVSLMTAPGYSKGMLIARGMCVVCALVVPGFVGTCPDETALDALKHEIAYQRTNGLYPLSGSHLIPTNVWVRGPFTGFYVREQLPYIRGLRARYIVDEYGSDSGSSCPVEKNWQQCIADSAGAEHGTDPIRTSTTTINLRAIPAWRPSPNDQAKKKTANELRREIEVNWQGASEIVIRDFNLKDSHRSRPI